MISEPRAAMTVAFSFDIFSVRACQNTFEAQERTITWHDNDATVAFDGA
jgi:hypothetical protein